MRNLFDSKKGYDYVRLDDDVSFQLLRTNPVLTSNAKIIYDGDNIYLESYPNNHLLATQRYKHVQVSRNGFFNRDLKNFLLGTKDTAYEVQHKMSNIVVGNDFDYQFENIYWCGAESIDSKDYSQELGFIAPLYLRKKLPKYFVIFKISDPSNYNLIDTISDRTYDFKSDILNKATIIKSFDLSEESPLGKYIRNYTSQVSFKFDQSIYTNFSTKEIYFYGIDRKTGLLTEKNESFADLLQNDNTITRVDDWITNGFKRNNLIFPYILNLEFLFDDNETKNYQFGRYFGIYCDDIDLYESKPLGEDINEINENEFYYIKDKFKNLYSLKKRPIYNYTTNPNVYKPSKLDEKTKNDIKEVIGDSNQLSTNNVIITSIRKNRNDLYLTNEGIKLNIPTDLNYNKLVGYTIVRSNSAYEGNIYNRKYVTQNDLLETEFLRIVDKKYYVTTDYTNEYKQPFTAGKTLKISDITGYDTHKIRVYCEPLNTELPGKASYTFRINKPFSHGETLSFFNDVYKSRYFELLKKSGTDNSEDSDFDYLYDALDNYNFASFVADKYYYDYYSDKDNRVKYFYIFQAQFEGSDDLNTIIQTIKNYPISLESLQNIESYIVNDERPHLYIPSASKSEFNILNEYLSETKGLGGLDYYVVESDEIYKIDDTYEYKESNYKLTQPESYIKNRFSCNGTTTQIAEALCQCINNVDLKHRQLYAYHKDDLVVIEYNLAGSRYNNNVNVVFDNSIIYNNKITQYTKDFKFNGGTDDSDCLFKINSDDLIFFTGEETNEKHRYILTYGDVPDTQIIGYKPYINEYGYIDENYLVIATDKNGKFLKPGQTKQVELADEFFPTIGILNFYPVKDFDFDTIDSVYGDDSNFQLEISKLERSLLLNNNTDENVSVEVNSSLKRKSRSTTQNSNNTTNSGESSEVVPGPGPNPERPEEPFDPYDSEGSDESDSSDEPEEPNNPGGNNNTDVPDSYKNIKPGVFDHINVNRLYNTSGETIVNEYHTFYEHLLPELCTISKSVPYITKWSYIDGVDSCENPYRLNMNKVFGLSNLSANLYFIRPSIMNFTHSLPYYLVSNNISLKENEYQYINDHNLVPNTDLTFDTLKNKWLNLFQNTDMNVFDELFLHKNTENSKIQKKYSKFKFGSNNIAASTLFRGVKFTITERRDGIEYNSPIYNDYKFSFIYIPFSFDGDIKFHNKVYFVKNDTFKFIVGIIFVNTLEIFNDYVPPMFNKSYVYGCCYDLFKINTDKLYNNETKIFSVTKQPFEDIFLNKPEIDSDGYKIYDITNLSISSPTLLKILSNMLNMMNDKTLATELITNVTFYTGVDDSDLHKYVEFVINKHSNMNQIVYQNESISFKNHITSCKIKTKQNVYVNLSLNTSILDKDITAEPQTLMDGISKGLFSIMNSISANAIYENIKYDYKSCVVYNTDDFKISIERPQTINILDIFDVTPKIIEFNNKRVVGSVDIIPKDVNNLNIKQLHRYSGYYNPIFKDILFYKNNRNEKFLNSEFDYNYQDNHHKFGIIQNMYHHKISTMNSDKIIRTLSPKYPIIGEYALDFDDYNIFNSSWDMNYFTNHITSTTKEKCSYIAGLKEGLCMFGSKYFHVPEKIDITDFNGCCEWNDDYIDNPDNCPYELMYKEVNGNNVNYYLFLRKRIIRYFCENEQVQQTFKKYINPKYSFASKETLQDDIEEYVKKNIIDLYEIDNINLYVKKTKRGINDTNIENDYVSTFNDSILKLLSGEFKKTDRFSISKENVDRFDKTLVYNLTNGFEERFVITFSIKKI